MYDEYIRQEVVPFIWAQCQSRPPISTLGASLGAYYASSGVGASNDDPNVERWITQARSELNPAKRQALYNAATKRVRDRAYFTFLLNIRDLYGTSERLRWTPRQDSLLFVNTMSIGG